MVGGGEVSACVALLALLDDVLLCDPALTTRRGGAAVRRRGMPFCRKAAVNMSVFNLKDGVFKNSVADARVDIRIGLGGHCIPMTRVKCKAASAASSNAGVRCGTSTPCFHVNVGCGFFFGGPCLPNFLCKNVHCKFASFSCSMSTPAVGSPA